MNNPLPPRPDRNSAVILEAAARQLAPEVIEWMQDDTDDDFEGVVRDLVSAMRFDCDGYKLGKELEQIGWDTDASLVEILDNAAHYKRMAWEADCTEWVKANNIPEIPVNSIVKKIDATDIGLGTVEKNRPDGTATVRFLQLGHKEGCGLVLPWEKLEVVPT